ncbi:MAG: DUF423 domain-containing protein [Bacteroidetes bacterium]|nr:DUF423 domain-containing protein [Bacteroidota bacterium]
MSKKIILAGTIFAALSVCLGAFAAHGLKKYISTGEMDAQMLENFQTAARYQMYHALALVLTGILQKQFSFGKLVSAAGGLFIIGIIFFSGSLYLLSMRNVIGMKSWEWLGPVTPIGGICFISGWALLAIAIARCKEINSNA